MRALTRNEVEIVRPLLAELDRGKLTEEEVIGAIIAKAPQFFDGEALGDNAAKMIDAKKREASIDFERATAERQAVVTEVTAYLEPSELEEFVKLAVEFKLLKVTPGKFYGAVVEALDRCGVDQDYCNLRRFVPYAQLWESIEPNALDAELKEIVTQLREVCGVS